jgi:DNA-binding protein HU-beta
MTKADIVADIAEETGLERNEALRAVEAFMNSIKASLAKGNNVYLRGFGSSS